MGRDHSGVSGQWVDEQGILHAARDSGEEVLYYYWLRKLRKTAAASMPPPQLVRLEESSGASEKRWIEIRYGEAELKLPEDVDLKAVVSLLHALRSHD